MEPYIGEIRLFAGSFAPSGWAFCNGQLLSIAQYDVLFALIGTTYGGDGQTTFALPDLRGRIPVSFGTNPATGTTFNLGSKSGTETVTLTANQMAAHTHAVLAQSEPGSETTPTGHLWARSTVSQYSAAAPTLAMSAATVTSTGGNQPHENLMPFLAVSYIIALEGIFPPQS